jgi:hypothetical protein
MEVLEEQRRRAAARTARHTESDPARALSVVAHFLPKPTHGPPMIGLRTGAIVPRLRDASLSVQPQLRSASVHAGIFLTVSPMVRNELLLLCLARARECVVSSCFPGPEVDDGSQLTASSPAWAARGDHAISGKARVVACGMD